MKSVLCAVVAAMLAVGCSGSDDDKAGDAGPATGADGSPAATVDALTTDGASPGPDAAGPTLDAAAPSIDAPPTAVDASAGSDTAPATGGPKIGEVTNCGATTVVAAAVCPKEGLPPHEFYCPQSPMMPPEPGCVHPMGGTLPGFRWCCPNPLCIRWPMFDSLCTDPTRPRNYSCAPDAPGRASCTMIGNNLCCPF
jgi:hypothetical protein